MKSLAEGTMLESFIRPGSVVLLTESCAAP